MTPAYNAIPKFLKEQAYKNPTKLAPFNLAYQTDLPVFKWRESNPENAKAGQAFMAAQRIGQRSVWDNQVPMQDFQLSREDIVNDRVLVCDVGGGSGHQCLEFRKHHPQLTGRIVTEDLGTMQELSTICEDLAKENISMQPHDFFEEQPVKGAKVYYLRNVIHNWNDEPSKIILSQIAKAMASDSVVIVDDVIMPQVGAGWKQSSMDLAMMTMLAAMERTKDHFSQLLNESGLQLRDVWTYDSDYGDSFIVAVPKVDSKTANGTSSINGHAASNGASL
ncbi:uncharacterized protein LTR77_009152 [Saxophila tyrrhenica]|uniref:O-methyltransferase C-terminal domain-containing protein n=1 Tax=Saxophila tyrrhenica TaxID=1690608 RepID=A0AAV9NYV0_9PEZI|nr:hypothetical protein LTR77_009152 [Saxophila tyrrhenica]